MKTFYFLLSLLLITGCKKSELANCIPSSEFFSYQQNKSLQVTATGVSVTEGSGRVFQYLYNYESCSNVQTARSSFLIFFELPPSLDASFSLSDTELLQLGLTSLLNGTVSEGPQVKSISTGSMQGTKGAGGTWRIKAQLMVGNEAIQFEGDFSPIP